MSIIALIIASVEVMPLLTGLVSSCKTNLGPTLRMGSRKGSERNGEVQKTVAPGTKSPCVCENLKKSDVRVAKIQIPRHAYVLEI